MMWRPAVLRVGDSSEPGSPAGGRRRGALRPADLSRFFAGTRMCCTHSGSKAAGACKRMPASSGGRPKSAI